MIILKQTAFALKVKVDALSSWLGRVATTQRSPTIHAAEVPLRRYLSYLGWLGLLGCIGDHSELFFLFILWGVDDRVTWSRTNRQPQISNAPQA